MYDVWDDVISGLGMRVGMSGQRAFFLRRNPCVRSATIGNADTVTVPETHRLHATFTEPPGTAEGQLES